MDANQLMTFGDVRRTIIDTIVAVRDEKMDVNRGMAIAALFKTLNDNVQVEVNAAKTAMKAKELGHDFGRVVGMGQKAIGNSADQLA